MAAAFLFTIPITLLGLLGIFRQAPSPLADLGTQLADRKQYLIFLSISIAWLLYGLIVGVRTLMGRELTDEWWELQASWVRLVIGIGMLWCGVGGMGMLYLAVTAKK